MHENEKTANQSPHPLRAAREERGFTLEEVARRAGGLYFQRLWEWEVGRHVPTRPYAERIAPVLGFEAAEALRAACRAWITDHAVHSHSLLFATQEQRARFLAAALPHRTECFGTAVREEGYAVDLISRGVLSEEIRGAIESEYQPRRAEWNRRGKFEWGVEAAQREDDDGD